MNNLEEQKLTVLEVQISDELSAEELDIVSGGCGQGDSGGFHARDIEIKLDFGPRVRIGQIATRIAGRFERRK